MKNIKQIKDEYIDYAIIHSDNSMSNSRKANIAYKKLVKIYNDVEKI